MTVGRPWHPIPLAMLFLWMSACLAVLAIGLGVFGGASEFFVEKWMFYLTFPLGVLVFVGWHFPAMALPQGLAVLFEGRVAAFGLWLLFVAVGYWQWFKAVPWLLAKVNLRPFSEPPERIGRIDIFSCACVALAALSGTAFWLAGWSRSPGGSPTQLQWQPVYLSFFAGAISLARACSESYSRCGGHKRSPSRCPLLDVSSAGTSCWCGSPLLTWAACTEHETGQIILSTATPELEWFC